MRQHQPYQWTPMQMAQHRFVGEQCFNGTYVNTLSTILHVSEELWTEMLPAAPQCGPGNFVVKVPPAFCILGGSLVLCRGLMVGSWGQERAPCGHPAGRLCQLPEGARPARTLAFAALAQAAGGGGGAGARGRGPMSQLATLTVTPDGWVQAEGAMGCRMSLDLGALRFSLSRGLALVDEVRLHSCDLPDRRLVVLQGRTAALTFQGGRASCLTTLPVSCQPADAKHFIASGSRDGNYHLVSVHPTQRSGGELFWCDSKFQCMDQLSLSGVLFEVAPAALQHALGERAWTESRREFVVREFQQRAIRRCGNLFVAWSTVFDKTQAGFINFAEFVEGCKKVDYRGCRSRLWDMLDDNRSGEICFEEFKQDAGEIRPKSVCNEMTAAISNGDFSTEQRCASA